MPKEQEFEVTIIRNVQSEQTRTVRATSAEEAKATAEREKDQYVWTFAGTTEEYYTWDQDGTQTNL